MFTFSLAMLFTMHCRDDDHLSNLPQSLMRCTLSLAPSHRYASSSDCKQVAVTCSSPMDDSMRATEKEKLPSPTSSTSRELHIAGGVMAEHIVT